MSRLLSVFLALLLGFPVLSQSTKVVGTTKLQGGTVLGNRRSIKINSITDLGIASSASMALTGINTVGNVLVLTSLMPSSAMTLTGATDSASNGWTVSTSGLDAASGGTAVLRTNGVVSPGVTTITVTATSPSGFTGFWLYDLTITSAGAASFATTQASVSTQGSTTNQVGPSLTPTGSGIIIAVTANNSGQPAAISGPFSAVGSPSRSTVWTMNPTTSAISPSWTTLSATTWCASAISLVE